MQVSVPPNKLERESGVKNSVELVIPEKNTLRVVDHEEIERHKHELAVIQRGKDMKTGLGMAHGLKHRFVSLLAQIRSVVNPNPKPGDDGYKSLRDVFAKFDLDGNGMLDKSEFLVGCSLIKVDITEKELNSLWPMLDIDMSGEIGGRGLSTVE